MPDSQWYYAVAGEQLGPVSTAELREAIRGGNVGPEDLVWCEGMPDWTESRAVKALAPPRRAAKAPNPAATAPSTTESAGRHPRSAAASARADAPVVAPPVETPRPSRLNDVELAADTPISSPSFLSDSGNLVDSGADPVADAASEELLANNQYNLDDSLPDALAGHVAEDSSESESDDELSEPVVQPQARRRTTPTAASSSASAVAEAAPHALYAVFLLVLWIVTALALMAVSIAFAIQWKKAADAAEQTATATTFVVWFVAVYCIARACERVLQLLGHSKP